MDVELGGYMVKFKKTVRSLTVRIYLTRHGQVNPQETFADDPDLPKADPPLTRLGESQAALTGRRLVELGFQGVIYASPFRRTLKTAQAIANFTKTKIQCAVEIREIVKLAGSLSDFTGLSMSQMLDLYPDLIRTELAYPWWQNEAESFADVCSRVSPLLEKVLAENKDCLLVGHGASVAAANHLLLKRTGQEFQDIYQAAPFNCSLSMYEIQNKSGKVHMYYDYCHIPLAMLSSNAVMALREKRSD